MIEIFIKMNNLDYSKSFPFVVNPDSSVIESIFEVEKELEDQLEIRCMVR